MTDHLRTLSELCRTRGRLRAQRRPAGRGRPLPREPGDVSRGLRALPRRGLAQPGRRLLRHHRRARRARWPSSPRGRRPRPIPHHQRRARLRARGGRARRRTTARCSSASAPTCSAAASSSELIAAGALRGGGRDRPRPGAAAARRSSTSACRTPIATRSPTSTRFLDRLVRMVKVPLMIDSTDAAVMERALTLVPGQGDPQLDQPRGRPRALRAGRAARPALRRRARRRPDRRDGGHGGHASSASSRSRGAATGSSPRSMGVAARGHLVGPARLPLRHRRRELRRLGGGRRSRACARLKARVPADARRSSAISNVSFGLPPAGREVLNSVFLYHCDAGRPRRRDRQHREARALRRDPRGGAALAETLIFLAPATRRRASRGGGVHRALPRPRAPRDGAPARRTLPLDERLARAVVEGTQGGARARTSTAALADPRWPDAARHHQRPADGRHGRGRPAVQRQPADRRRGAAERRGDEGGGLPPRAAHGEGGAGATRGKVLLATVKGDVHDIGKNLVDIVLANNGFEVVNLGIKVPSERLDPGGARAPAGRHRPLRPAREERAADGGRPPATSPRRASTRRSWSAARRSPAASPTARSPPPTAGSCTYATRRDARPDAGRAAARSGARGRRSSARSPSGRGRRDGRGARRERADAPSARRRGARRSAATSPPPPPPDLERHVAELDLDEVWA